MKLLREYIRKLLTESAIDSKIMSMIDRAEAAGYRALVYDGGVSIYDPSINVSDHPTKINAKNSRASVKWYSVTGSFGPCLKAAMVNASRSTEPLGPLAYDLAIEYSGGLVSDRMEVSSDARAVWDYYMDNRSDVIKHQLDDMDDWLTPDREDNCTQEIEGTGGTAVDMFPDSSKAWVDSSLSKMYKKSGTPVMDELRRRNMLDER